MTFQRYRNRFPKGPLQFKGFHQTGNRLEAEISLDGNDWHVWFESDDVPLTPAWEALLPLTLRAAMHNASSLRVGHPIDAVMLANIPLIMQHIHSGEPSYAIIPIEQAPPAPPSGLKPNRVGVFFSGGVDSWYTLLVHMEEITDLVFVAGTDIPLGNTVHLQKSIGLARKVAEHYGKRLVVVRTNLRSFTDQFTRWHKHLSSLLQSLSYLMVADFRKMYFSTSFNAEYYRKQGSYPGLTDLWSGSTLQVVESGLEANRVQRAARVAEDDFALANLRVCWQNPKEGLNCGVCDKCLYTMVNLEAAGALERCHAFNHPLDLKLVAATSILDDTHREFIQTNLDAIFGRQGNSPLARALRASLRRSVFKRWFRRQQDKIINLYRLIFKRKKRYYQRIDRENAQHFT